MRSERSIRVYLSIDEYERVTFEASRRGLPASAYIRVILLERLERAKPQEHPRDAG